MMYKKKAQSLSEYSIGLAVVLIALIAMNVYVKRGLQGRYKDTADSLWQGVKNQVETELEAEPLLTQQQKQGKRDKTLAYPQYEPYYVDSTTAFEAPRRMTVGMRQERARRDLLTDAGPTRVSSTNVESANVEGWQPVR